MNVLDLFSGIGGFSLGLERAGMRTVAFCERDEYCRAVLRKHWPDVPCFDDIHAIDADGLGRLGRIDLVCGGFPCQPFSVAGKQKGKEDDRHLWPEMCRVIALARPTWVIGENVTGLITLALDDVLADLESIGYTARTFVIPACAVGAPHKRDRLWIVARDANSNSKPAIAFNDEASGVQEPGDVADTSSAGLQRSRDEQEAVSGAEPGRLELASDGAAWQWPAEPGVGRVAHGIPRRVDRLRCLGNAVVPQIPEIIGRAIMSEEIRTRA